MIQQSTAARSDIARRRGFSLLELLIALTIIAIVSAAVSALLMGSAQVNSYVNAKGDSIWQIEDSSRRITHNLRTCSSLDSPTDNNSHNALTIHTQQDPNNSNTTYQVSYQLSGTNLQETDSRYGTNTIAQNVTSFTVQRQSSSSPFSVQISITAGTTNPVTRTFTVYCRNL